MYDNTHRAAFDSILSELAGVAQKGKFWFKFHCPLEHEKKNATAEIWLDTMGRIGVCCYDCGRNTELRNVVVRPHIQEGKETEKITYRYEHPDGTPRLSFRTDRPGGKRIWQPKGQNISGTFVKLWPPARGDDGGLIVWVEGEKCAASIAAIGYVGASTIAGASNVHRSDFSSFEGRSVLVWPDDDEPGRIAGEIVADLSLSAGAYRVQLALTGGTGDGGDAADLSPTARLTRLRELLAATPDFNGLETASLSTNEGSSPELKSQWTMLGEVCAEHVRAKFRFDIPVRRWLAWREDNHWESLIDTTEIIDILHYDRLRLAAQLGEDGLRELSESLANASHWRRESGNSRSEWWGAMRITLGRPSPNPPSNYVATPGGIVDVETGDVYPHDPTLHDTLAVTRGSYHPTDAERLRATLWNRLRHNVSPDDFDQLIAVLGVAVARRSTDYSSIVWFYGASGSGKGATANLIQEAFGTLAIGLSANILGRRSRSDIDADLTDLIEIDPIIYCASEVGRVGMARLNGLTGGDSFSSRRPHGRIVRGALSGMLLATSVEAPNVGVEAGLRRRLIVIHFPRRVSESISRNRRFNGDELDAVVTLSILAAMEVESEGWTPPRGSDMATDQFLREADPVAAFLNTLLPDEWDGRPVNEVREAYNYQYEDPITSALLGRRINASANMRSVFDNRLRKSILRFQRSP